MSLDKIVIATRKSPLALWQAEYVKACLETTHAGLQVELLTMTSRGDKLLDVPLAKVGGKGLFVKELEHALLEGTADIAVHSMKDVPMQFPEGLGLATICEREDPHDAFVSNRYATIDDLPECAVVGTSSLRRECQLRAHRPDLQICFLRGNVNSRLQKLDDGDYDAIILACAGLKRLKMAERIRSVIPAELSLPAGGQGAVGIEVRTSDTAVKALLEPLHHPKTACCVEAERAMNRHLNGGCQVPIACYAVIDPADDSRLWLRGLVGSPDGKTMLYEERWGSVAQPEALGVELAEALLARGAGSILQVLWDQQ